VSEALDRIANALDRLSPIPLARPDFDKCDAFLWQTNPMGLIPISNVSCIDIKLLLGIDNSRDTLRANTEQFSKGFPANNALLWGARGMGKSSLIKAVHRDVGGVILIEIQREDLSSVAELLNLLRNSKRRFLLFCDDLSFDHDDTTYKSLKAVLDGGIEGRPENVLFYATSNRRHLMPRDMIENEGQSGVNPAEAVEEKVSLSDRFGLWLGFHSCSQDIYLAIIKGYCDQYSINISTDDLYAEAIEWQATRGSRSGRVAWQFFVDLAGRRNVCL
jgi:predicted AAA+ superfamily ATPase